MKARILILVIVLLAFSVAFAEGLTEKVALEQIEMEQARLDAAVQKHNDCKAIGEPLMQEVEAMRLERDNLLAQLENLKTSRGFYTVKSGDWLSKLAEYKEVYGKGNWKRWPEIYKANKRLIKDPDLIYPNWKLEIPRP